MATLEALEEASTYIVHFRASRPRRRSSAASSSSTSPSTSDRTTRSFEDHVSVPGAGVGRSVSTSYITSRTRSDSAPSTPPSAQLTTTTTTTTRTTTSNTVGENNNDTNNNHNNNSSAVSYRETTMMPQAHASLTPTAVDAVVDSNNNNNRALLSAHWPQAQSDSEPYSGSSSTDATIATISTATAASTIVRGGNSSHTTVTQDSTDILYQPKQECGGEDEGDDVDPFDPDCAICLDRILPLRHAKAVLACRHEFHLSCISMAFAMGKEMICPLCRYLHKDQPFMTLESDEDLKPITNSRRGAAGATSSQTSSSHTQTTGGASTTLHEHPTSGTVLSMMPSLFETSLGHGPTAGTIRTAPNGICLSTSTWLLLYAMPFSVALCFLAFVLGKVETLWSKISCLIGAAICYMVCWALVVAIMDPDHEARAILERLDQDQQRQAIIQAMQRGTGSGGAAEAVDSMARSRAALELTRRNRTGNGVDHFSSSSPLSNDGSGYDSSIHTGTGTGAEATEGEVADPGWPYSVAGWVPHRYAQDIQNRLLDFNEMLDRVPDMMGEW